MTTKTTRSYPLADAATRAKAVLSITALKDAGVPLGRKPSLTDADVEEIKRLHALGLGTGWIGREVRTLQKSDGAMTATSPRVIRKVLSGVYESREAFERRNHAARRRMLEVSAHAK